MRSKFIFENSQGEIWRYGINIMVYIMNPILNKKITAWKHSKLIAAYHYLDGRYRYQFRLPLHKLPKVIGILVTAEEESWVTAI